MSVSAGRGCAAGASSAVTARETCSGTRTGQGPGWHGLVGEERSSCVCTCGTGLLRTGLCTATPGIALASPPARVAFGPGSQPTQTPATALQTRPSRGAVTVSFKIKPTPVATAAQLSKGVRRPGKPRPAHGSRGNGRPAGPAAKEASHGTECVGAIRRAGSQRPRSPNEHDEREVPLQHSAPALRGTAVPPPGASLPRLSRHVLRAGRAGDGVTHSQISLYRDHAGPRPR